MNIDYSNIKKDKYIVQGLTIIDNLFFISAYKKNDYSRLYIYNTDKYLGKIILDNKYHVGGISFDKKKQIIFSTGSAKSISTYNYTKLIKLMNKDNFTINLNEHNNIIIKNNLITPFRAATLYIYKGYIYITKFDLNTKIAKIKYSYDNKIVTQDKLIDLGTIKNSFCVQGISLYKDYLYLSSSLGATKSFVSIYDKNLKFIKRRIINQMGMEGIIIKNDILYSIYEMGKQRITLHHLNDLDKLNSRSLFLKWKYTLSYKIYHKIKNRKHK